MGLKGETLKKAFQKCPTEGEGVDSNKNDHQPLPMQLALFMVSFKLIEQSVDTRILFPSASD